MSDPPIVLLKAVAHPSRYAILAALSAGERNVGEIEAVTNIGQPALSQQLSVLRKAGLVSSRRAAKLVYYSIDTGELREAIAALEALAQPEMNAKSMAGKRPGLGGAAVFAQLD